MHGFVGENNDDNQTKTFSFHTVTTYHVVNLDILDMTMPHMYSTLITSHTLGGYSLSTSMLHSS